MRCFKCCGRQPWTSCGLLINRENKVLFMALLGQINKCFAWCWFLLCLHNNNLYRHYCTSLLEVKHSLSFETLRWWTERLAVSKVSRGSVSCWKSHWHDELYESKLRPVVREQSQTCMLSCCAHAAGIVQLIRIRLSLTWGYKLQSVRHVARIIKIQKRDSILAALKWAF